MKTFGKTSNKRLSTCNTALIKTANLALNRSRIDFGISEGERSLERQQELFEQGKSKIDGKTKKGKHNYSPSLALDFYIYHPDPVMKQKLIYDKASLCYVAGVFISCFYELKDKKEIPENYNIRWGGNWDRDGVILADQSFDDLPHLELIIS